MKDAKTYLILSKPLGCHFKNLAFITTMQKFSVEFKSTEFVQCVRLFDHTSHCSAQGPRTWETREMSGSILHLCWDPLRDPNCNTDLAAPSKVPVEVGHTVFEFCGNLHISWATLSLLNANQECDWDMWVFKSWFCWGYKRVNHILCPFCLATKFFNYIRSSLPGWRKSSLHPNWPWTCRY